MTCTVEGAGVSCCARADSTLLSVLLRVPNTVVSLSALVSTAGAALGFGSDAGTSSLLLLSTISVWVLSPSTLVSMVGGGFGFAKDVGTASLTMLRRVSRAVVLLPTLISTATTVFGDPDPASGLEVVCVVDDSAGKTIACGNSIDRAFSFSAVSGCSSPVRDSDLLGEEASSGTSVGRVAVSNGSGWLLCCSGGEAAAVDEGGGFAKALVQRLNLSVHIRNDGGDGGLFFAGWRNKI